MHFLTRRKVMKDLTIINEKFVLVDKESSSEGITVYYVEVSKYNDGFFDDEDIININVEYVHQSQERISGWEYPQFTDIKVYPNDLNFDFKLAEENALEVANELIIQYTPQYV